MVNSGTINANTVSTPLQINASTINAGKLEATTGGTLILDCCCPRGGILSNVNNTIAGAGFIGASARRRHVVNSGAINANTVSATLFLNATVRSMSSTVCSAVRR